MPKLMSLWCGRLDRAVLAEWHRDRATTLRQLATRHVIDIVDLDPTAVGWPEFEGYPAHPAVEECWLTSDGALDEFIAGWQGPSGIEDVWHYRVDEFVRKDVRRTHRRALERVPGVKELFLLTRPADKSHAQFAAHWHDVHGPLALRQHVGMSRYVQNVVRDALSTGAPCLDGIAELHFPSVDDARTARYSTPDGPRLIASDRPNFVGRSEWLFTGEVRLR